MKTWKLKRTAQCAKCPWRVDVNPRDIPNGYDEKKHRALARTIAPPVDIKSVIASLARPLQIMACHESHDAHCVGWLANQLGPGNNIALRIQALRCENVGAIRLRGRQHKTLEDTLPKVTK